MTEQVTDGYLHGDVPFLKVGHGPPLVSVLGLSPDHQVPTGMDRRFALTHARPLADHFTVYVVNRRRGLKLGQSMSDIAGHVADAIEHDIGEAVFLDGTSTGGSVVLQLAVDRPRLVRRLVVISAAYKLGTLGRQMSAELARLTRAGEPRQAWASAMSTMLPRAVRTPARPLAWLAAGWRAPDDPTDLLATIDAEDVFDVEADLARITAPTLVIGGDKDRFYSRELFEGTAAGVSNGRVHIFRGYGHGRASMSTATNHLTLGFMLGEAPAG